MTPSRQKAKPVFDPQLSTRTSMSCGRRRTHALQAAGAGARDPPPGRGTADLRRRRRPRRAVAAFGPRAAACSRSPATGPGCGVEAGHPVTSDHGEPRRRLGLRDRDESPATKRARPPEVLLSAEVYDELYRVQIAEKKVRRGLARTMGAIVLDAIEAHASRLATTWSNPQFAVGEGQIFERLSSNAVPRRRRHATAPRTVVLSGVTAANGQRLDDLVQAWDAGPAAPSSSRRSATSSGCCRKAEPGRGAFGHTN